MLYSKLVQGETRSQGTHLWNGRKEARGHPWRPFTMEGAAQKMVLAVVQHHEEGQRSLVRKGFLSRPPASEEPQLPGPDAQDQPMDQLMAEASTSDTEASSYTSSDSSTSDTAESTKQETVPNFFLTSLPERTHLSAEPQPLHQRHGSSLLKS